MGRYGILLLLAAGLASAFWFATSAAYKQGVSETQANQAAKDLAVFNRVMEEIQNENLDVTDSDAVFGRLCGFAGITDLAECRALYGDGASTD